MKNTKFSLSICVSVFLLLFFYLIPVEASSKASKICKKATKKCISLEQGDKTVQEALQDCIDCCVQDREKIKSEKCFNFCTDKCAIKFTGMTVQ